MTIVYIHRISAMLIYFPEGPPLPPSPKRTLSFSHRALSFSARSGGTYSDYKAKGGQKKARSLSLNSSSKGCQPPPLSRRVSSLTYSRICTYCNSALLLIYYISN